MRFEPRNYNANIKELHDAAFVVILEQHFEYFLDKCRYEEFKSKQVIDKKYVEYLMKNKENVLIIGNQKAKLYNFKEAVLHW